LTTYKYITTAPHRHDLPSHSCINNEIQVFNRKLYKMMKTVYHETTIQTSSPRDSFTQHELLMNASGKTMMANIITSNIKNILTRSKIKPIILEWKLDQMDPTHAEITSDKNDRTAESKNNAPWTSRRQRKKPVTRNEDFLWTSSLKTTY
jgi:hypothetical protein